MDALKSNDTGFDVDDPWYSQWPSYILVAAVAGIFVGCAWCAWSWCSAVFRFFCLCTCFPQCARQTTSDLDSAGSCYPPPRYSRCGSLHRMPPPYSEVTSKPDMYPLVLGSDDNKSGSKYLMVHYFRNYVSRNTVIPGISDSRHTQSSKGIDEVHLTKTTGPSTSADVTKNQTGRISATQHTSYCQLSKRTDVADLAKTTGATPTTSASVTKNQTSRISATQHTPYCPLSKGTDVAHLPRKTTGATPTTSASVIKNQTGRSLSATSTAESLNSSCICNAANEANSIIPPPYSFSENYEEWGGGFPGNGGRRSILRSTSSLAGELRSPRSPCRPTITPSMPHTRKNLHDLSPDESFRQTLISSPIQESAYDLDLELSDYEFGCECRPKLGHSPPVHRSPSKEGRMMLHDIENYRRMFKPVSPDAGCSSPPQPTSPTQGDYTKRSDILKQLPGFCKASMYMSFSPTEFGSNHKSIKGSSVVRASSRSAPATPNGVFGPNVLSFPTFSQRVSGQVSRASRSSRLEEEDDPLLEGHYNGMEHKF